VPFSYTSSEARFDRATVQFVRPERRAARLPPVAGCQQLAPVRLGQPLAR